MPSGRVQELLSSRWPTKDLETVESCPVCGGSERTVLHDGLWDNSALSAPGRWKLWRCSGCGSAYLDPRPTKESIGRAYQSYYTHNDETTDPVPEEPRSNDSLRAKLAGGYRYWRFGIGSESSNAIGAVIGRMLPAIRRGSDAHFRYLPKTAAAEPRVLDVGCGGGQWLSRAAQTRWKVFGADPDPSAVNLAKSNGLTVRQGGIEVWKDSPEDFDALTMSHVIEHVHDPRDVLKQAWHLLKPGGQLYVETPNIDALGHSLFGRNWRGLEAPRHLVLFNGKSLLGLLRQAGFVNVRQQLAPSQLDFIVAVSNELRSIDPDLPAGSPRSIQPSPWTRFRSRYTRSRREFLTVTCSRPL